MSGRLYIPEVNQISGPWMLNHNNLESLDKLFKDIDDLLKDALENHIDKVSKQQGEEEANTLDLPKRVLKLQRKYSQRVKSAEIALEDGTAYKAADIEGILNYFSANPSYSPSELYIRTNHGGHENEFDLIVNANAGKDEVDFEYRIKCLDEEIQLKIKALIDKWTRENEPSLFESAWEAANQFLFIFAFIIGLCCLPNLEDVIPKTESYQSVLKKQAHEILDKGVSSIKSDSILVLLLKLQSDYTPSNYQIKTETKPNKIAWRFLIISLFTIIAQLPVRPKTVIGIGSKHKKYKLYKNWIRVMSWLLVLILGTLIGDVFVNFIHW